MRTALTVIISLITSGYLVFILNISGSLKAPTFGNKTIVGIALFSILFCITFAIVKKYLKNEKYKLSEVCRVLFIAFICIFLLGGIVGIDMVSDTSEAENRALKKFPRLSPFHEEFPKRVDEFVNDRVGLRPQAFALYSKMRPYLFDDINLMRSAIIGKNYWIFYNADHDTIPNFQRTEEYTQDRFEELMKHILKVKEFCDAHGIKLYFMVPPNKSTVYPEFYPAFLKRLVRPGYYEVLINYLNNNLGYTFVDVYANMMKEKDNYTLYYKEDTHWNSVGAYFAYQKLAEALSKDFPNFLVIKQEDLMRCDAKNKSHDLVNILGGSPHDYGLSQEFCISKPATIEYIQKFSQTLDILGHLKTDNSKSPKVMVFQDSFMGAMENYINNGVSESMNAFATGRSPLAYEKEILGYKPDIIIWEVLERNTHDILTSNLKYKRQQTASDSVNSKNRPK